MWTWASLLLCHGDNGSHLGVGCLDQNTFLPFLNLLGTNPLLPILSSQALKAHRAPGHPSVPSLNSSIERGQAHAGSLVLELSP